MVSAGNDMAHARKHRNKSECPQRRTTGSIANGVAATTSAGDPISASEREVKKNRKAVAGKNLIAPFVR